MKYRFAHILIGAFLLAGCQALEDLPPGTQFQSSTFGLRLSPRPIDGNPLTLSSHTTVIQTPPPEDAGPSLNRAEMYAPFVRLKTTVAAGPVGEQLEAAGGPAALEILLQPPGDSVGPILGNPIE